MPNLGSVRLHGSRAKYSKAWRGQVDLEQRVPYHIRLGGESVGLKALQGHPLDRQASMAVLSDAIVFLV